MKFTQDVLTTGQVAKICNVAPRTVSKWFDTGRLRGYRIPGSRDRRIPAEQLVRFMKAHGIPLNGLDGRRVRVLVVDPDPGFAETLKAALTKTGRYHVESAACIFSAGIMAEKHKPHVILMDTAAADLDVEQFCRCLRGHADLGGAKLIALAAGLTDAQGQSLLQRGFHCYLNKPCDIQNLTQTIEAALAPSEESGPRRIELRHAGQRVS